MAYGFEREPEPRGEPRGEPHTEMPAPPRWRSPALSSVLHVVPAEVRTERFAEVHLWPRVDRSGGRDTCWPWTGPRDRKGYGRLNVLGKSTLAHRLALETRLGRALGKSFACHLCNNPPCCNPDHLYEGDAFTNANDREAAKLMIDDVDSDIVSDIDADKHSPCNDVNGGNAM